MSAETIKADLPSPKQPTEQDRQTRDRDEEKPKKPVFPVANVDENVISELRKRRKSRRKATGGGGSIGGAAGAVGAARRMAAQAGGSGGASRRPEPAERPQTVNNYNLANPQAPHAQQSPSKPSDGIGKAVAGGVAGGAIERYREHHHYHENPAHFQAERQQPHEDWRKSREEVRTHINNLAGKSYDRKATDDYLGASERNRENADRLTPRPGTNPHPDFAMRQKPSGEAHTPEERQQAAAWHRGQAGAHGQAAQAARAESERHFPMGATDKVTSGLRKVQQNVAQTHETHAAYHQGEAEHHEKAGGITPNAGSFRNSSASQLGHAAVSSALRKPLTPEEELHSHLNTHLATGAVSAQRVTSAKTAVATHPEPQPHPEPAPQATATPPQADLSDIAAAMRSNLSGTAKSSDSFLRATAGSHETPAPKPAMPTNAPWKRGMQPGGPGLGIGEDTASVTPSDYSYGNASGYEDDQGQDDDPAFDDDSGDREDGVPASAASYIKPQAPADDEIDEIVLWYATHNLMLNEVTEKFGEFVESVIGITNEYLTADQMKRQRMFQDMVIAVPWDGRTTELMRDRLRETIEEFARIEADAPPEDLSNLVSPITGDSQSDVIINPSLSQASADGHEIGDHDYKEAIRNHLKKRIQARRYLAAAQDLKASEVDQSVDDEDLENCGIEPGQDHGAWQEILKKRRERIRDQSAQTFTQDGGPSVNQQPVYSGAS